jgi:hypothetical protein
MKAQVLVTSVEPTEYIGMAVQDLEPLMTPEEREVALVKGWLIKGVEPGGEEVFSFRISAEHTPPDIDQRVFQPLEIDCRGVTGRGWVRSRQTKGSVEATITFQAVAVAPLEMAAILEEQRRRQQQVKADVERRSHQREYLSRLRLRIEERLKGGLTSAEPVGAASNGAGGGGGKSR